MPTDDVENTNGPIQEDDLQLANKPWTVLQRTKVYHKGIRGTGDLQFSKRSKQDKNITMAWIDYKKAYCMVL